MDWLYQDDDLDEGERCAMPDGYEVYRAIGNETPKLIAEKCCVPVEQILELNSEKQGFKAGSKLYGGTWLRIGPADEAANSASSAEVCHV